MEKEIVSEVPWIKIINEINNEKKKPEKASSMKTQNETEPS